MEVTAVVKKKHQQIYNHNKLINLKHQNPNLNLKSWIQMLYKYKNKNKIKNKNIKYNK